MILPVLFFLAALCSAQELGAPARELARKIGRQDIANLTVRNASSLPESEAAEVKRTIEGELRPRLQKPEGATVNVTLSENLQGYLWVGEVVKGEEREVVMVNVVRPKTAAAQQAAIAIEKKALWEQERPILDLAMASDLMVVLEPNTVGLYRERQLIASLPVTVGPPAPRDPRGRLALDGTSLQVFLPGVICKGVTGPTPSIMCAAGGDMAAGKNYFANPALPPFYSIATLSDSVKFVTGADGRTRVYDGSYRELSSFTGWGSDIAAMESGCGAGKQVLASKPGDAGEPDAVQAYQFTDRRAIPIGDPVTFPGPVTALWSSGTQAMAVSHNLETGKYAAYSLAISCGR